MKKIIVRIPQWLGDAVVSTIFIARLRAQNPQAHIAVLCLPFLAPIFESHPDVNEVLPLPYKTGGSIWNVAKMLREKSFDEAYILPKSFRTALEAWLGGIPKRVGFFGDMQRFLLTIAHRRMDHLGFDPYRYLNLLGEKNVGNEPVYPYFPNSNPTQINNAKKPILGIAPKSVAPARTWDVQNFAQVAQRFQKETGGSIFLFGVESERPATAAVKSKLSANVFDYTGQLNLPEQGGLLGGTMAACDYFLCNDSGLMHVAIALGVPTLAIYGSGDPGYTGYNKKGPFLFLQHKEIPCVPCLRNDCYRRGDGFNECLRKVTPQEVLDGIKQLGEKIQKR